MRTRITSSHLITAMLLSTAAAASSQQAGQGSKDGLWADVAESSLSIPGRRDVGPTTYRTLRLDPDALHRLIEQAPLEFTEQAKRAPIELTLPLPDGTFATFRVVESPMLGPTLAATYPEIKTYSGRGVDDPTMTMRFDLTSNGFHAIILSPKETSFIAPYARGDMEHCISYFLRNDPQQRAFHCHVEEAAAATTAAPAPENVDATIALHNYKLLIATTSAFSVQHGNTEVSVIADVTSNINQVNAIFRRELTINLILDNVFAYINGFNHSDPDPYTSGNLNALIEENQDNLNVWAGFDDLGQVFDAAAADGSAGGLAAIGSTCDNTRKFKGTSGGNYVFLTAHELAHQFGATHSFNSTSGSCGNFNGSNQRDGTSSYEPDSGSTLMSYGGSCAPENVQLFRDLYFHANSIQQIKNYITTGGGSACPTFTDTGDHPPLISLLDGASFNIPVHTPFRLRANAFDLDGDAVTVNWEEFDLGNASPPQGDNGNRPLFRSLAGPDSPAPANAQTRFFPDLSFILTNFNDPPLTYACAENVTCLTGETLPATARTMAFEATARDGLGGVASSASVFVSAQSNAGPFVVTYPEPTCGILGCSGSIVWSRNTVQTVTWDVANTNQPPVNCQYVKITLSDDGGSTFAYVLADNVPNTGSANIVVPGVNTSLARVKVEAVGNIFFDISNEDFTIRPLKVTNSDDNGAGSLRQAIIDADNTPVAAGQEIVNIPFEIFPHGSVYTVNLATPLPPITRPITLDAWGEGGPGYTGPPLMELNGANCTGPCDGLNVRASSLIRGFIINRFNGSGIFFQGSGGSHVEGCYIGTDSTGTTALGNGTGGGAVAGVTISNAFGVVVGGTSTTARNIISANNVDVYITGGGNSSANVIDGNYIGTDVTGTVLLGNTSDGVKIFGAPANTIGGPGAGNVIAANTGIEIVAVGATGNAIQGNYIGINAAGTAAFSNSAFGIIINGASNNTIGGTIAGAGNVISGNHVYGIAFYESDTANNVIQGNFIGTNATGTAAIANGSGIYSLRSNGHQIGGTTAGARNVISGNLNYGILIGNGGGDPNAGNNIIQGNFVGTNASGTGTIPNGFIGIVISDCRNNLIGGTAPGAGNLISGNYSGIHIDSSNSPATGNVIQGNFIGTDVNGTAALGNYQGGIQVVTPSGGLTATNNTIGGNTASARNVIAANGEGVRVYGDSNNVQGNFIGIGADGTTVLGNHGHGIEIVGNNNLIGGAAGAGNVIAYSGRPNQIDRGDGVLAYDGVGNTISGNSIFANGNPNFPGTDRGISLGTASAPANDSCDADAGSNNLQNYPMFTSAVSTGTMATIAGTLNSTPNTSFTIEFFSSNGCDPSGFGQGQIYLGAVAVATTGSCVADFTGGNSVSLPVAVAPGQVITATATDPAGNTSEFSQCIPVVIVTPTASPTATPTPSLTPTPTPIPSPTSTPTPTATPTPSSTPTPINVAGTISYCSNPSADPVPGVTLTLTGTGSGSTLSDSSGNYQFSSLIAGGSYTVTPTKSGLPPATAGINTIDAIATQRHFLVIGTPLSGCPLTAADVNGDNAVNTVDAVAIQRFFLGLTGGIANVGKYRFNPVNRAYSGVTTNQIGQNYNAIIFGDVASGFVYRLEGSSQTEAADGRSFHEIPVVRTTIALPEITVDQSSSKLFAVVVTTSAIDSKDELVGFQGDFTFDARVISFDSEPVQQAGLTAGDWSVSGNVLDGAGPIRTLRVSAYSNKLMPLSGSGALFKLRLRRASEETASTALVWAAPPDGFLFIDANLETQQPESAATGRIILTR